MLGLGPGVPELVGARARVVQAVVLAASVLLLVLMQPVLQNFVWLFLLGIWLFLLWFWLFLVGFWLFSCSNMVLLVFGFGYVCLWVCQELLFIAW